jgi:hypothetical protein
MHAQMCSGGNAFDADVSKGRHSLDCIAHILDTVVEKYSFDVRPRMPEESFTAVRAKYALLVKKWLIVVRTILSDAIINYYRSKEKLIKINCCSDVPAEGVRETKSISWAINP